VLDGEIVYLGEDGRLQFYDLMGRQPQYFYAFDLIWNDRQDLRRLPLLERKKRLLFLGHPAAPTAGRERLAQ
jgi:bifunctional non-homologous end joining protein LigD